MSSHCHHNVFKYTCPICSPGTDFQRLASENLALQQMVEKAEKELSDLKSFNESESVKRVVKLIKSFCQNCGHPTTEDGCINCIQQSAQKPLLELLEMFRFNDMENEFSLDDHERQHYDLLKAALFLIGWKGDRPEDTADFEKRKKGIFQDDISTLEQEGK